MPKPLRPRKKVRVDRSGEKAVSAPRRIKRKPRPKRAPDRFAPLVGRLKREGSDILLLLESNESVETNYVQEFVDFLEPAGVSFWDAEALMRTSELNCGIEYMKPNTDDGIVVAWFKQQNKDGTNSTFYGRAEALSNATLAAYIRLLIAKAKSYG